MTKMTDLLSVFRRPTSVRGALNDDSGATAVVIALALVGMLGFAGLGSEAAMWYYVKRDMQSAADAGAATAAANAAKVLYQGGIPDSSQLSTDAQSIAAKYGYLGGSGSTVSATHYQPTSGPCASVYCVQVSISQPQRALISGLFLSTAPTIAVTAAAKANTQATDSGCVLALNGASVTDVTLNGGVNMKFSNCALYDNSPLKSGNDALYMSNNAQLTASAVYVSGAANQTTGITTTDGPTGANSIYTGVNPTLDPYANVALPSPSTCNSTQKLSNPSTTLTASGTPATYVFCKDVSMDTNGNNPVLTLNPGIYIFACGANLNMTSGTLNATGGVTLVFERACPNGTAPTYPGYISVSGNANLNITAPTTGPTAGIALFQDRVNCPNSSGSSSCSSTLGGGGNLNITGAAYFPSNLVNYSGGANGGGTSQCTQLVASTITFSGNTTFNNNCTGTGVKTISYTQGWLTE